MKNRLERIKTTYNEHGNYDRELYFNEQKEMYKRQIQFIGRVSAITDEQFTLKPLEISFLTSTALKDEQKFKDIKKTLQEYNKNIIQNGGAAENSVHFKKVVMESMLKFMRLMLLAPDTGTKKTILDIAYHWFIRHLDPKSGRKTSAELQRQIKQIIIQKQLLPIEIVNRELIINRVNQQLQPYKIKARTMYNELDDPKFELENYNTHKLQFTNTNNKQIQQKNKHKKWIDTVKFPKIQPLVYQAQPIVQDHNKEQQIKVQLPVPQQLKPDAQKPKQIKLDAEGRPIPTQEVKPPQNQQPQQDLDFGQPQEGGQPQPEEQQEQVQQKRRGKLDPLLKIFVLQRIRGKEREQISCDKIREKKINQNNITYEQDMLNGEYLREWARKRARLKSQIAKKSQSTRGADKVFRAKHGQYSQYIENDIDKIKIRKATQQHKRNITMIEAPQDKLNAEQSLSIFDRRRVKTEAAHKPFSSILNEYSRKAEQNKMLTQIQEIKQKFSKYKLFTPMDKLIKGLAPPDDEYIEDNDKITWPNSQMLSNPFIKVSKKKKKKKKKK